MIGNGQTFIWIPSMLTLSRLSAEAAATINAVHTGVNQATGSSLKTDYTEGETHEYYLPLNDLDMGGAPFTRDAQPGMAVCGPIENVSYLDLNYVALICAFGGDVEGLPLWFELDDITEVCPFSDSNETWETWGTFGDSHVPVQLGGKWYRSNCVGESGAKMHASQCMGYRAAGGVVLTQAEYLAVVAANTAPIDGGQ
jgi:hypothetical protein